MKIINSITEMQQEASSLRAAGQIIGFVPTMGYLHEGHLSLMRIARKQCDVLISSIFVNPTQFGPNEDLDAYPRNFTRDEQLCAKESTDILFYPTADEMYPSPYRTYITVDDITDSLCGKSRPVHFRGVATVVAKLFNIVQPHLAVFGQKDYQQLVVIRQLVRDMNFDVEILAGPIVREQDGLAMSSRNAYLSETQRELAPILYKSLKTVQEMVTAGTIDTGTLRKKINSLIIKTDGAAVDYIEIVDAQDLKPVEVIEQETLIALAVHFGRTRLIDNTIIHPDSKEK